MVDLFETTSSFDRLPYEVLECIAGYLKYSSDSLRQFQLLNKRCQLIAEKHLFKSLILSNRCSPQSVLRSGSFMMEPRRCKLVKDLSIREPKYIDLNDSFFNAFCNITSVDVDFIWIDKVDWQHFSETFTPERCKLKKLPDIFHALASDDDEIGHYRDVVEGHSQTLEYLNVSEIVSLINRSCNFPRVKKLDFGWLKKEETPKDVDDAISKCPLLERLNIKTVTNLDATEYRPAPYVSDTQHPQLMRKIFVRIEPARFIGMCNYLAAKFPNVQEWYLRNDPDGVEEIELFPFEGLMDALHLIMKSTSVELNIFTTYSSISRIYGFLELYKAHTNVSIRQIHPSAWDNKHEAGNKEVLILELSYHRSKSMLNTTTLEYVSDGFRYLELIEIFGHGIQNLTLSLVGYGDVQQENVDTERILRLLDNCPALASFTYSVKALKSIGHISNVAIKSLKKMVLKCRTIDSEALTELSHIAPGVVDLTINSCFTEWTLSNNERQILINMPKNSFDRLVLHDYSCYSTQKGDRNIMLVQVTTLASSEDRCYIQTQSNGVASVFDEQEDKTYSQLPYIKVAIICQSVKRIECYLSHEWLSFDP